MTVSVIRAFEAFVEDLSNWYIRRSRRRFWKGEQEALRTLWFSLVTALRVIAPVVPFLTEHLWRILVVDASAEAPDSVFLAGWPQAVDADAEILAEIEQVRRVVELGRQARAEAKIKLRQPLRQAYVRGAELAKRHADEIRDELRVKRVGFDEGPVPRVVLRPNLPILGPRLGGKVAAVRAALQAGEYEELPDGGVRVAGEELTSGEVIRGERMAPEGVAAASDNAISIALDTTLDDELRTEGQALDLIRKLNEMRKEAGLELTDRITVTLPPALEHLLRYSDRIQEEVLAVSVRVDASASEPGILKA
jgi:isoleucyl-tRNA synthetase